MKIQPLLFLVLICLVIAGCGGGSSFQPTTPSIPVAAYSFTPSSPTSGQAVTFTDISTGSPTAWAWSFGDGVTSTYQNPSHTYSTTGTFTVTLTASNAGGSNAVSHSVNVSAAISSGMTAQFSVVTNGQVATFTDTSTGNPPVWAWNFGDGTTSAIENPTQTYLTAGTYTVTLTVSNSAGTSSSTTTQSVTVSPSATLTAFTFARAANNTTIAFTDNSIGVPTSWAWDFGDGNTSTQQSPTHTYAVSGQYTVKLMTGNTMGSNQATHTIYISPLSNLVESLVPAGTFVMGDHFRFVDRLIPAMRCRSIP